jgi:hypothetical protein
MEKFKRGDTVKVVSVPRGLPKWTLGNTGTVYQVGKFVFHSGEVFAYHIEFKNGFRGVYNAKHLDKVQDKQDATEVISNVSGVSKDEVKKIWEGVKANQKLLSECKRPHVFLPIGEGNFRNQQCTKCKGIVEGRLALYYKQGLVDGKRNA